LDNQVDFVQSTILDGLIQKVSEKKGKQKIEAKVKRKYQKK